MRKLKSLCRKLLRCTGEFYAVVCHGRGDYRVYWSPISSEVHIPFDEVYHGKTVSEVESFLLGEFR